jgi:uncharacterized protein
MFTLLPFLPILICVLLILPAIRHATLRPALPIIGLITILTSLVDWLLLALLPTLRLSYGPVRPPAFMLNFIRMAILLIALPALLLARSGEGRKVIAVLVGVFQAVILAISFYSLYIEPFRLGVTEVSLPQAPAFLPDRPLRILQITDIHLEHPTRREEELLARVTAIQPDLIVLTGDYINTTYLHNPDTLAEIRQILSQLYAPYGVYAVNGSVDSVASMQGIFNGLENIIVLNDETLPLAFPGGTLTLVGVANREQRHNNDRDRNMLKSLMSDLPSDAYTLLLHHTPDLIETASATGVDLYLAGHTHGGQIRLPFYGALITFSEYGKQYEMGQYQVGPTTLYVSRGIGLEGGSLPRIRFLCPPELVLVELGK